VTICISIKVPDGLVLAADSMSTYSVLNPATQGWEAVQSYSYANKLIQLGSASIGTLAASPFPSNRNLDETRAPKTCSARAVHPDDSRMLCNVVVTLAVRMWKASPPGCCVCG
jgi:hypothetical protein